MERKGMSLCISNIHLYASLLPPTSTRTHSEVNGVFVCMCNYFACKVTSLSKTLTSANVGEVDSIDGSSEARTLGACEVSTAVQCGQDQCPHGKQGV